MTRKIYFSAFSSCLACLICCNLYAQQAAAPRKHHILILPIAARSIETDWSFGVAVSSTFHLRSSKDSISRTSNIQGLTLYTLQKQIIAVVNGTIYFPGEKYILNQQFSYSYFPDKFWGLGKNTPDSAEEPFSYKQFYIYLHPQRLIANNIFLGFRYEYQKLMNIEYIKGGLFDKENVAGRYDYHVSGLGLSITYDTRNNAFSPDKGSMLQFYFSHFDNFFGSDYKYTNFVLDARRFMKIYKQQVLALQLYGFFNSGETPLRSLGLLGGSNMMRGYYSGRFRDKTLTVFQAEYRVPVYWRIGVVAFGGVGNVSSDLKNIDFNNVKYSLGGGLRLALNKAEKLNLRLDYGVARGGSSGFYFQLGEAF